MLFIYITFHYHFLHNNLGTIVQIQAKPWENIKNGKKKKLNFLLLEMFTKHRAKFFA